MDRSHVRTTWVSRWSFALGVCCCLGAAAPIAAQTPPVAAPAAPAAKQPRITGMLKAYRPPTRSMVVMKSEHGGPPMPVEIRVSPDAIVIVDGMETPVAGLQSDRPIIIERPEGRPMRIVQGVLPPGGPLRK